MYRWSILVLLALSNVRGQNSDDEVCESNVSARTTGGLICGTSQLDINGKEYASFRGVPYAKPPLGTLRFEELQAVEPWDGYYNASVERDICPQTTLVLNSFMKPRGMSEDCIHANIHVPLKSLPKKNGKSKDKGLPVLVFIHGGVWEFGSGDTDLFGPERLVANDVIVITFNYRLNVFGLLSLNTTKIPGNNSLRDAITLLKWVKNNAKYFGGNPNDVTLGGQSAGGWSANLLALSPAAKGLFKKSILMSGTALSNFFTTSPGYASSVASSFLTQVGITSTDPDEIHQQLVDMPLETLVEGNKVLLNQFGVAVFFPVIDSSLSGVESIIPEDAYAMLAKGYGKDIPTLIGFLTSECSSLTLRLIEVDILSSIASNVLALAPAELPYKFTAEVAQQKAQLIADRYFNGEPTLEKYITSCSDSSFVHAALELAKQRQTYGGKTFMYKYSYDTVNTAIKSLGINYTGAAHFDDLSYVFQFNEVSLPYTDQDNQMKEILTEYITNFVKYGDPSGSQKSWPSVDSSAVRYRFIQSPSSITDTELTEEEESMVEFFDSIIEV